MLPRGRVVFEQVNRVRRRAEQVSDQVVTKAIRGIRSGGLHVSFDGNPRFALLTVNYSTTRYLTLMLLSLLGQEDLNRLQTVVICDNNSRDGGISFLRKLSQRARRVVLVENRWWANHARGMRVAIRALDRMNKDNPCTQMANILLACDPDVLFLRDDTLLALAQLFADGSVSFAGQLRRGLFPMPEAQASFLAVRRDWAARKDVSAWVNHGSPAYWMQRDIWSLGGLGADFRSNEDGYILHRGRSAVAAAGEYAPWSSYATTTNRIPHFMGVPRGGEIWSAHEEKFSKWLEIDAEPELLQLLSRGLG